MLTYESHYIDAKDSHTVLVSCYRDGKLEGQEIFTFQPTWDMTSNSIRWYLVYTSSFGWENISDLEGIWNTGQQKGAELA